MTPAAPPAARTLSAAFGVLMVAATEVQTQGPALVAAALAAIAVLVGIRFRPAATLAVMITVSAIVLTDPSPLLGALAGFSATAYLVLRYPAGSAAVAVTQPTIVGAVGLTAAGVAAAALPAQQPWLPLLAPCLVFATYVVATHIFTTDRTP